MAAAVSTRAALLLAFVCAQLCRGAQGAVDAAIDTTFFGHHLLSVRIDSQAHLKTLLDVKDNLDLDFWSHAIKEGHTGLVRVPPESFNEIVDVMESAGIQYYVNSDNLQSLVNEEKRLIAPDDASATRGETASDLLDYARYYSYKSVTKALLGFAKVHSFLETQVIGQTHDDNDIIAVKVASESDLPVILIDCGVHAREWITISACMYIVNELVSRHQERTSEVSEIFNYEWRVIPCLNPDGYEFSRRSNRMWRKNRSVQYSSNGTKCYGTDLNRNFDVSFCSTPDEADPCKETFCGKAPFSEPESHAFREYVTEFRNRIAFYFSFHAFGDLWLIPYSFRSERPPDYDELMARANRAVAAIQEVSGTLYKAGSISSLLYIAPGTAIDWMYVKKGVRMSFTIEISSEKNGFFLNQSNVIDVPKQAWVGVVAAIQ
ncbi:carboxypeptidase B-like isoform X1 [Dermacentor albipictus]|uniref:carboxypeptidase B-like isoform X1 n=1 Tax=Dermacentor albipictus TaxID=60249 RepID=UPI0031FDFE1F